MFSSRAILAIGCELSMTILIASSRNSGENFLRCSGIGLLRSGLRSYWVPVRNLRGSPEGGPAGRRGGGRGGPFGTACTGVTHDALYVGTKGPRTHPVVFVPRPVELREPFDAAVGGEQGAAVGFRTDST